MVAEIALDLARVNADPAADPDMAAVRADIDEHGLTAFFHAAVQTMAAEEARAAQVAQLPEEFAVEEPVPFSTAGRRAAQADLEGLHRRPADAAPARLPPEHPRRSEFDPPAGRSKQLPGESGWLRALLCGCGQHARLPGRDARVMPAHPNDRPLGAAPRRESGDAVENRSRHYRTRFKRSVVECRVWPGEYGRLRWSNHRWGDFHLNPWLGAGIWAAAEPGSLADHRHRRAGSARRTGGWHHRPGGLGKPPSRHRVGTR